MGKKSRYISEMLWWSGLQDMVTDGAQELRKERKVG